MDMTVYVPVKGFPGYHINFDGEIFREYADGILHHMKPVVNHGGYYVVRLRKGKKYSTKRVHILTWTSFIGKIPFGYQVNHRFGNKAHNGVMDLELMTQVQNIAHSFEHGLRQRPTFDKKLDDIHIITMYTLKHTHRRKDLVEYSKTTIRNVEMILSGHRRKKLFQKVMLG